MPAPQHVYWLLTIPYAAFDPNQGLPPGVKYLKGQQEEGGNTGYHHWQLLAIMARKSTLAAIKRVFGESAHCEPSRSAAANDYVWKEDTRVADSQFELGEAPFKRNDPTDWAAVRASAIAGDLDAIPADVFVRNYHSLKRITKDYSIAHPRPTTSCKVFWGDTGTGKSHLAWEEAGQLCYVKNPSTKWWDAYKGEENVLIDEFTGQIGITYLLRWLDIYCCRVEEKGGDLPLKATNFWICSNIAPTDWYPDATAQQRAALLRRLAVTHFNVPYGQ